MRAYAWTHTHTQGVAALRARLPSDERCALRARQGHMGDPVKDHEAKLKYIMEAVHFNPQNLMGWCALRALSLPTRRRPRSRRAR